MFPDRQTAEITYRLTGAWGQLFNDVLAYARELVERAEGQGSARAAHELVGGAGLAALHLLVAGRRRQRAAHPTGRGAARCHGHSEAPRSKSSRRRPATACSTAPTMPCRPTTSSPVPRPRTASACGRLMAAAAALAGEHNDPKLAKLQEHLALLLKDGFQPVVFCRYIATAHYLAAALRERSGPSPSRPSPAS